MTLDPSQDRDRFQWLRRFWKEGEIADHGVPTPDAEQQHAAPRVGNRWPTRSQVKYLPKMLTPREWRVFQVAALVLLASGITLFVRFLGRHIISLPKEGGVYIEGSVGAPKYVNPVLALSNDVDLDLTHLMFSSLFRTNEKGEVIPSLVSHTEISQDQKTYIFTIRQGVLWHDDVPLTADDVVFTFERIADPESQSPYYKNFRSVAVEAIDEATVQMTLPEPFAPFLSTLTVGIIPKHLWSDVPPANMTLAEYNLKPVGSGPFMFEMLTKDRLGSIKSYHVVRFPKYFGNRPFLKEMNFRFYPTKEDAADALKQKKVDGLAFITSDMRTDFKKLHLQFHQLQLPQYTAVFFNQKNALLKEKIIRQSLERALSKQEIIDSALGGSGEPIHTPILPGFLGYNPAVQGLAYNLDEAKKALDNAGWVLPAGETTRRKNGKELRFALSTVDRPDYMKTTEMLRDYWAAIGVGIEIRLYSSADIVKKVIKPREYEALLFGEIIGNDPDPYPFWHSSQSFDPGLNLAIFYNKQVDQLLEEARQTNDPEQRRLKYLHFQNILAEEQPAVFLYNPLYIHVLPTRIKGATLERISVPSDRLNDIDRWYINVRHQWSWRAKRS